ncbi:ABC transporter permease [Defluviimonas sp. WL0050]|uniref:Transport permease protein n=2 Tax=Albidovulum litorale TaxID=2984134 RepID=A0ABT2ZU01_9RHOB|nr:ABC transporter permease [Defluviimonas sp. WL0050]
MVTTRMSRASPPSSPDGHVAQPAALPRISAPARRFAAPRTIFALVLREMATTYGRSPGGYIWAVLEPLGAILILALAFSLLIRHPPLGTSFVLFYSTGYLPFSLYQSLMNAVSRALVFSRPLLMYPAVSWMDALLARAVLNTLTGVTVIYLLMSGIFIFTETNVVVDITRILSATAMAALLGFGVGSVNCLLIGVFPVWEVVWSIFSRPLFLASGILFVYEDLPRTIQSILWFNPLIHIIGEMRTGFYPMYSAEYVSPFFVIFLSLTLITFSFTMLRKYHLDILNDR